MFDRRLFDHFDYVVSPKKKVPFSIAIGNGELMHECFPKHSRREQQEENNKETDEDSEKRGVSVERRKASKKKKKSRRNITN